MDVIDTCVKILVVCAVILITILCIGAVIAIVMVPFSYVGTTQIDGYVVRTSQYSFPWKTTTVKFTIEHPTSVVDAEYFSVTYGGHHEFDFGTRYRITAYREWGWWYPKITEVEIIE